MGDFVKASTDPGNILSALFIMGSTAIGGPAAGFAAASAVAGASATVKASGAQQVELDLASRDEKLKAEDREAQRRRRLNAILGAQAAHAAASGVSMSGSVANISLSDARQAGLDRINDRAGTRIRINTLARQRKSVGQAGIMSAAGQLLTTGSTLAQGVKIKKTPTGKTTSPATSGGGGTRPGRAA